MDSPKWPTMKSIELKMRHTVDMAIDATVSIDTGRPVVAVHRYGPFDDEHFTPAEARRLAKALVKAADCVDAKCRAVRRG